MRHDRMAAGEGEREELETGEKERVGDTRSKQEEQAGDM